MHAQPNLWNGLVSIYRTVAVVDLVGYSSLARMLEENMGAPAVAELNRRIQDLIQEALAPLPSCSYTLIAKTGDGALVLFEDAPCAHQFAVELHQCAARHNTARSDKSAQRSFRIGIASGDITVLEEPPAAPEYAGITIANAVRLETAAKPGEIVVDLPTFNKLPAEVQSSYSSEATVHGKREESFRVRKWRAGGAPAVPIISRRRAIAISLGETAGVGLGCWGLANPRFIYMLHPLPARRFVAFAAWPQPAAEVAAVTREVVSSMKQSLQRMETFDHSFLVVEAEEPGETAPAQQQLTPLDSAQKFGANLAVLAASEVSDERLHLSIKVIDTKTQDLLRHATLSAPLTDVAGLRERAIQRVVTLLNLPQHVKTVQDDQEIAKMPPRAYQMLAEGKALEADFNGSHRAEGIQKLQELVNTYPSYAVGYGELAAAYIEQFRTSREPADLGLAEANAKRALQINPDSGSGLLSSAKAASNSGKPDVALGFLQRLLSRDPHNPDALLYRADVYREKGDYTGQLSAYQEIIDLRPNYWRAYNDRGLLLEEKALYENATENFQMAVQVAPGVSMPLTNLGDLYLETDQTDLARAAFQKSISIFPTANAYAGLGTIAFGRKDYAHALDAYSRALKLTPRSYDLYRDIGDCQTMLGQTAASTASFKQAAILLTDELKLIPWNGARWMLLSLYHAKIGATDEAYRDIRIAEEHGATSVDALLTKAQALAVLGHHEDALKLLLDCVEQGVSPADIALAVDLTSVTSDPRYVRSIQKKAG
jgi:tetratricopeptide (TPR) repeat protein/class 3 adenylate cyclase